MKQLKALVAWAANGSRGVTAAAAAVLLLAFALGSTYSAGKCYGGSSGGGLMLLRQAVRTVSGSAGGNALLAPPLPPAPPPPPPPSRLQGRQCQEPPDVSGSLWARHCQRLHHVCVDQSQLILYGPEYQQQGSHRPRPLPQLWVTGGRGVHSFPWRSGAAGSATQPWSGVIGREGAGAERWQQQQQQEAGREGAAAASGDAGQEGQRRRLTYKEQDNYHRMLEPPPLRPASLLEATPYLQRPTFSNCTVPVLLTVTWQGNLWHVMDNAARWHSMLRRTPWRQHIKPVVLTPEGWALTDVESQLLPLLSPHQSLQTLADFSRRLPASHSGSGVAAADDGGAGVGGGRRSGGDAPLGPAELPPSYEGPEQRCFSTLFFCGGPDPDKRASGQREAVPTELFSYGQVLAAHWLQRRTGEQQGAAAAALASARGAAAGEGPARGVSVSHSGHDSTSRVSDSRLGSAPGSSGSGGSSNSDGTSSGSSSEGSSSNSSSSKKDSRKLRVVVMKRDSEGRQLLNVGELLSSCNAWRYRPSGSSTGSGRVASSAECWEVRTPNISAAAEALQHADVLVGIHGSNLANAWMLRPGSSVIEIMPYGWASSNANAFLLSMADAKDPSSRLLWHVGVACHASLSTPGPAEAAGIAGGSMKRHWARDRNVRLPWPALREMLEAVVAEGGDRERFMRGVRSRKRHRFNLGPAGVLSRGPRCPDQAGRGSGNSTGGG